MTHHFIKYIALVKELSDGEILETEGHLTGITTELTKDGKLKIGALVRDTKGEIV